MFGNLKKSAASWSYSLSTTFNPCHARHHSVLLIIMTIPTDPISRHQWNEDFERKLAKLYPEHGPIDPLLATDSSILQLARLGIQSGGVAQETDIRITELCILQRDLSVEGIRYLGGHDLETNWNKTPETEKQRIAREAMYLSCDVDGFENFRLFCPEMTSKNLSERFISLLSIFTIEENAKKRGDPPYTVPIYIKNDLFDQYMKPPAANKDEMEPFLRLQRISRTYCITLTIWYMLLTFVSRKCHCMCHK